MAPDELQDAIRGAVAGWAWPVGPEEGDGPSSSTHHPAQGESKGQKSNRGRSKNRGKGKRDKRDSDFDCVASQNLGHQDFWVAQARTFTTVDDVLGAASFIATEIIPKLDAAALEPQLARIQFRGTLPTSIVPAQVCPGEGAAAAVLDTHIESTNPPTQASAPSTPSTTHTPASFAQPSESLAPSESSEPSRPSRHLEPSEPSVASEPPLAFEPAAAFKASAPPDNPERSEPPFASPSAPPGSSLPPSICASPASPTLPAESTAEDSPGHAHTVQSPDNEEMCQPLSLDSTPAPLMSPCDPEMLKTAAHAIPHTDAPVAASGQSLPRDDSSQSSEGRKNGRKQGRKKREQKAPEFHELLHLFSPSVDDACDTEAHAFGSIQDMANATEVLARGGVTLNTRVKKSSELHEACDRLADSASMARVCPQDTWRFGPPAGARTGAEDSRYFVILGWSQALTHVHCDSGVQTVLYITRGGVNRVIGVPRPVASAWQAVRDSVQRRWQDPKTAIQGLTPSILRQIELHLLRLCLERGLLEWGEFVGLAPSDDVTDSGNNPSVTSKAGSALESNTPTAATSTEEETELDALVILPQAGHIVQTGSHKVTSLFW